jgi:hypothetical protein
LSRHRRMTGSANSDMKRPRHTPHHPSAIDRKDSRLACLVQGRTMLGIVG